MFGLLGGSMLELYDAMYMGGEIAYVGARDERAAGHMADAWARMTGKPGVVLEARRPGRGGQYRDRGCRGAFGLFTIGGNCRCPYPIRSGERYVSGS